MSSRICNKCKKIKSDKDFYKNTRSLNCKECLRSICRERARIYRSNPLDKERLLANYRTWYYKHGRKKSRKQLDYDLKWSKENRIKKRAASNLSYRTRNGKIKRPTICDICGQQKRIYGHHPDYAKIYSVLWLCGSCHKRIHNFKKDLTKLE